MRKVLKKFGLVLVMMALMVLAVAPGAQAAGGLDVTVGAPNPLRGGSAEYEFVVTNKTGAPITNITVKLVRATDEDREQTADITFNVTDLEDNDSATGYVVVNSSRELRLIVECDEGYSARSKAFYYEEEEEPEPEPTPGGDSAVTVEGGTSIASALPGEVIEISLPFYFDENSGWEDVSDLKVEPMVSGDIKAWPFDIDRGSYMETSSFRSDHATVDFEFRVSQMASAGNYPITFNYSYTASNGDLHRTLSGETTVYIRVAADGNQAEGANPNGSLVLGESVVPSADAGQAVNLRFTIVNNGGDMADIKITPVVSADLSAFPFKVENQNYSYRIPYLGYGAAAQVDFAFVLSPDVTSGTKSVTFKATYLENGVSRESELVTYVNVVNGKDGAVGEDGKISTPKLIISGYGVEPEKVYAGNTFTMNLEFRNTSKVTIKNLTINISNADVENSYVVPAKNGSNTIYVASVGAGATVKKSIEMQVRPDTPAKPNMMVIEMRYEDSQNNPFTATENITIPINQEIRLTIEEPRFDSEFLTVGASTYASFNIINKGKSSIYNTMVEVEGAGLRMEESFYAGTIGPGTQYSVDFSLVAEQAGQLTGDIIISYENEYGDVMEERLPVSLMVEEFVEPDPNEFPIEDPSMMEGQGMATWLKVLLIVLAVALVGGGFFFIRHKKRKKREAELAADDDDFDFEDAPAAEESAAVEQSADAVDLEQTMDLRSALEVEQATQEEENEEQ